MVLVRVYCLLMYCPPIHQSAPSPTNSLSDSKIDILLNQSLCLYGVPIYNSSEVSCNHKGLLYSHVSHSVDRQDRSELEDHCLDGKGL